MSDLRDKIARALYDSATAKARNESAHVAAFEGAAGYFRATLTDQADAVLAVLDLDEVRANAARRYLPVMNKHLRKAEFDRMLAQAWDEGMEAGQKADILKTFTPNNPYRKEEQ